MQLLLRSFLVVSVGLALAQASALKGGRSLEHVQPVEAPAKAAPVAHADAEQSPAVEPKRAQPVVPILESTKRIFNDELIRRFAAQQAAPAADQAVSQPAKLAEPVVAAAPIPDAVSSVVKVEPVQMMARSDVPAPEVPAAVGQIPAGAPAAVVPSEPAAAPAAEQVPARAPEAHLEARKQEEPAVAAAAAGAHEAPIEVPAPDPGLVLSEPIDSTTKLLIDLDEHVQKFLPAEEQAQAVKDPAASAAEVVAAQSVAEQIAPKSSGPLVPYSSDETLAAGQASEAADKAAAAAAAAVAASPAGGAPASGSQPAPAARQNGQQPQNQQQMIIQLLDQLETLEKRIQDTINQLVARRRYVMSALLRPMGTYVRRVRTNLERLQNRVNQLQAAAVSVGGGQNRPGGFVDAAAIETIRRRIDDISKRISDIVNRIRFSLTPTSAPLNSNGK